MPTRTNSEPDPMERVMTDYRQYFQEHGGGITWPTRDPFGVVKTKSNKEKQPAGEVYTREFLEETQKLHFDAGLEEGRSEILSKIMSTAVLKQTILNEQIELWKDEKDLEKRGEARFAALPAETVVERIGLKRRIIAAAIEVIKKDEKTEAPI